MSRSDSTAVRPLHVAAVLGKCEKTIQRMADDGRIPPPDTRLERGQRGWQLSTLHRWNPLIAEKIAALIESTALPPTLTL